MIDWNAVLRVATDVLLAFGSGWGGAVLSGATGTNAIASGAIAAAAYYRGQRQDKVDFKTE